MSENRFDRRHIGDAMHEALGDVELRSAGPPQRGMLRQWVRLGFKRRPGLSAWASGTQGWSQIGKFWLQIGFLWFSLFFRGAGRRPAEIPKNHSETRKSQFETKTFLSETSPESQKPRLKVQGDA